MNDRVVKAELSSDLGSETCNDVEKNATYTCLFSCTWFHWNYSSIFILPPLKITTYNQALLMVACSLTTNARRNSADGCSFNLAKSPILFASCRFNDRQMRDNIFQRLSNFFVNLGKDFAYFGKSQRPLRLLDARRRESNGCNFEGTG